MSIFETSEWETEWETGETGEWETGEWETGELGEVLGESYESQHFLGGLLGSVLGGEMESPLGEIAEAELATELLEITSEAELEQFLGKLIKGVGKKVGGFVRGPVGKALGGALKGIAKKALPVVGGALGSMVAPGIGTALGSKLGSFASGLFEVELEGLNEQEAEFEVARRFVRLAGSAAKNAALAPPGAPPRAVAKAAVLTAARRHAPGLVRGTPYQRRPRPPGMGRPGAGRPRPSAGRPAPRPYRPAGAPSYSGYGPAAPSWGPGYGADGAYDDAGDGYADGYGFGPAGGGASGRWVRRNGSIVLLGV